MTTEQLNEITGGAHILIAGATGSGKSVLLNNIIYHILRSDADKLPQFIFCDPKKVELWQYRTLPGCFYCCENGEIIQALNAVIEAMSARYDEMQAQNIRKYAGRKIIIVIDELADLMLTCRHSVLPLLQRVLQLGRAANIQIIACTQCPNRRVIPAELTLNFTDKVALRCDSGIESRQVINISGAEKLPKYGAGIWRHPGALEQIKIEIVPDNCIISAVSALSSVNDDIEAIELPKIEKAKKVKSRYRRARIWRNIKFILSELFRRLFFKAIIITIIIIILQYIK